MIRREGLPDGETARMHVIEAEVLAVIAATNLEAHHGPLQRAVQFDVLLEDDRVR